MLVLERKRIKGKVLCLYSIDEVETAELQGHYSKRNGRRRVIPVPKLKST